MFRHRFRHLLESMMAFMGLFLFLGCAVQAADNFNIDLNSQALSQGLEKPGVLRVGMEANYAPYNWSQPTDANGALPISNADGEYANGYDVQIAKKIAKALGLKLEIVKLEWDGLTPALESGKIDAIIAGMSPTPDREKQMTFSDPYQIADMLVVVQKDSPYAKAKSIHDFKGAKITAQLNTFHVDLLDQMTGIKPQTPMDTFSTMIQSLKSGKIDGYLADTPGAMTGVAANPDLEMIAFSKGNGFDLKGINNYSAVGLRKDSPLVGMINQVIQQIPKKEQDAIMQEMVDLNQSNQNPSFFESVGNIWKEYLPLFLRGAENTLVVSLISTLIGFFIGLVVAIYRSLPVQRSKNLLLYLLYKLFNFVVVAYIEIFRGTPMMVQAMLIFYGSKLFLNIDMSSMEAAFFIISINTGAYLAEVIRGGIISIDKGQFEAAKAIGMNHFQTMTLVILPQAIRSIMPALGNEFVINIKDTSVLNVIAFSELFFVSKSIAGSTYLVFQTYLITSIIYFVLTFTTTRILNVISKKMEGDKDYQLVPQKGLTYDE